MRVLVAEDEPRLSDELAGALPAAGCVVDGARDGERADLLIHTERHDAVLLDLGLPRQDGLALRVARARAVPVLVLTGADEYVAGPFRLEEVLARLRARRR